MKAVKRFKTQAREREIKLARKRSEEKEQKNCFEEEIVDAPCASNINTVVEKHLIRNFTC